MDEEDEEMSEEEHERINEILDSIGLYGTTIILIAFFLLALYCVLHFVSQGII